MPAPSKPAKAMPTVLISAANRDFRRQLSGFLDGFGAEVIAVENARALRNVARERGAEIDVIVADLSADGGTALAEDLAARRLLLKALLISGEPDYANHARWPQPWLQFIEKPFAWRDLEDKLQRLLRKRISAPAS